MSFECIDLKMPCRALDNGIRRRMDTVPAHGQYIMGPEVRELKESLADYVGIKYCIATASGTNNLLIALMALGIDRSDEVITTNFSFIPTAEFIALLGTTSIFVYVDIAPYTYNIDPAGIEVAITPKFHAILPVSLYGQYADYDRINAIAENHGLPIIEDSAQRFSATYKHRRVSSDPKSRRAYTRGIPTAMHYPLPLHAQTAVCGRVSDAGPNVAAERPAQRVLSLPIPPWPRSHRHSRRP